MLKIKTHDSDTGTHISQIRVIHNVVKNFTINWHKHASDRGINVFRGLLEAQELEKDFYFKASL